MRRRVRPGPFVYYKSRDCSIQSLQQRTFFPLTTGPSLFRGGVVWGAVVGSVFVFVLTSAGSADGSGVFVGRLSSVSGWARFLNACVATPTRRFFSEPNLTSWRALVPLACMDRSSLYDVHDVYPYLRLNLFASTSVSPAYLGAL